MDIFRFVYVIYIFAENVHCQWVIIVTHPVVLTISFNLLSLIGDIHEEIIRLIMNYKKKQFSNEII